MRLINVISGLSAAIGMALTGTSIAFGTSARDVGDMFAPFRGFASATSEESFSEAQALSVAEEIADSQLKASIGQQREVADGVIVPALKVQVGEMKLVASDFRPRASSFTSIVGSHDLGAGGDVWTFEWEMRGLSAPEMKMDEAVLRVVVAVEDGTGKLRLARVSTVNAKYADDR